jgi:lipopolysaccharide transport system ATP-binding protein
MSQVSRSGRTVLFVSHNMGTVSALCDRVVVLSQGNVIFDGPTNEGIRAYTLESQSAAEAQVNLAARTVERYGARQYACLRTLELRNADNVPSTTLQMGEKAVFRMVVDILKPNDEFEIGISIANLHGVGIHMFVSNWEGLHSIPNTGLHLLEVEWPRVYLFPGEYQVYVWITIRGQYYDDAVHEALRFSVEEGRVNSHPTHFERFSKNTQVYTPSLWKISQLSAIESQSRYASK